MIIIEKTVVAYNYLFKEVMYYTIVFFKKKSKAYIVECVSNCILGNKYFEKCCLVMA